MRINKNKILIFLIFVFNIYLYAKDKTQMEYILNAKSEAMGSTGMVFGEEYGAFFRAPTSVIKITPKILTGKIELHRSNIFPNLSSIAAFFPLRIENFCFGPTFAFSFENPKFSWESDVLICFPIIFAFQIKNFSLGIGGKYTTNYTVGSLISTDTSVMYSSNFGDFSLCIRDITIYKFSGAFMSQDETESLKSELRLGYAKIFEINKFFNEFIVAIELNNLLMNSIYTESDERDYSLFRKLNLGIDLKKNINNNSFSLKGGVKNLFPTFGISVNIKDIFEISYAFTNRDLGDEWGKERKIINLLSASLKLSDHLFN